MTTPEHRATAIISQAVNVDGDQVGHIIDNYADAADAFRRALDAADTTDATIALTMLATARRLDIADNTYRAALADAIVGETCRRWIRERDYKALTAVWYDAHGQPDETAE